MSESNSDRVAVVTGAGRGIGRAIAVALGGLGFKITVNYHANAEAAQQCAALIREAGGQAFLAQADVAKSEDRQRLINQTLERFGRVDLLVNNAGIAPKLRADLLEMTEGSYDEVMATNLKGPFFLTQQVARHMIDRSILGAIVNISSVSAFAASVNRGQYCMAKAGLAMATKLLAVRLAEHGIRVYEIRPGIIATDMTGPVKQKYDKLILEDGITPIRRWGQPEDVAQAVVAIAEGRLPFSTGQVINVDGGFHLQRL